MEEDRQVDRATVYVCATCCLLSVHTLYRSVRRPTGGINLRGGPGRGQSQGGPFRHIWGSEQGYK